MKLKPFNIYEWLKDTNQPVYTRHGLELENLTLFEDMVEEEFCFAGKIKDIDERPHLGTWSKFGKYLGLFDNGEDEHDLMLVEKNVLDETEEFINTQICIYIENSRIQKTLDKNLESYYLGKKEAAEEILEFIKKQRNDND